MPLFNSHEEVPLSEPTEAAPVIDTASVYHNREFNNKLISFISGSTWTVDYYAQYKGDDDVLNNDNDINSPTLNQFQLVKGMELRLQGSLEQTTDTNAMTTTVTGSAMMYPIIIPQIGDVIVAHIGDNLYGKFSVTNVTRQSLYKESAWLIEVNLTTYITDAVLADLTSKVVNTLIFDISSLNSDKGPLRTESEYNRNVSRIELMKELVACLYTNYHNDYHRTFIFNETKRCYDPFAVEFFNKIVDSSLLGGREKPRLFDFRNAIFTYEFKTIWDALIANSKRFVTKGVKEMDDLDASLFGDCYVFNTIDTTTLECVVHPRAVDCLEIANTSLGDPNAYPYVLSEEFYLEDSDNYTQMDRWVWDLINKQLIPYTDLLDYADNVLPTLGVREQFYHTILLIALLMVSR